MNTQVQTHTRNDSNSRDARSYQEEVGPPGTADWQDAIHQLEKQSTSGPDTPL